MTIDASPLRGRLAFVVGSRRSGTHWLERIVGAHPSVSAIPSETHLISHGIAPLMERFHHSARSSPQVGSVYADRRALLDAVRDLCDTVFGEFLDPDAELLLERTPLHARHLDLVGAIYPDARVIHIIRDGRDVARSLIAQPWGPERIEEAAIEWRDSVSAARGAALAPDAYHEVRYEALLRDPEAVIEPILSWLGLATGADEMSEALAEARRAANLDASGGGRVASEKWRTELTPEQVAAVERKAGALLAELGYAPSAAPPPPPPPPPPAPTSRHPQASPMAHQDLVDRALEAFHAGEPGRLAEVTSPDLAVTVVDPGGRRQARGERARALLAELIAGDAAFRGRQLVGDSHMSLPTATLVLSYEDERGGRSDRLLLLTIEGGLLSALTAYSFPLVPPAGGDSR